MIRATAKKSEPTRERKIQKKVGDYTVENIVLEANFVQQRNISVGKSDKKRPMNTMIPQTKWITQFAFRTNVNSMFFEITTAVRYICLTVVFFLSLLSHAVL